MYDFMRILGNLVYLYFSEVDFVATSGYEQPV